LSDSQDYWKVRAANPEAFKESEKKLWKEIEPILFELLDELKAKGKIETSYVPIEKQHLGNVMENMNIVSMNNNLLLHLADSPENFNVLSKSILNLGFDDRKSANLYIEIGAL